MGETYLEGLKLHADLGKYIFHDEGYVESIEETTRKITDFYKKNNSGDNMICGRRVLGRCILHEQNIHIFYLKHPLAIKDLQIKSHENTHVLDLAGRLDVLEDEMLKKLNVKIDFKKIENREVKAYVGFLYAMLTSNIPRPWIIKSNIYFREAIKFLKESKTNQTSLQQYS